MAQLGTDFWCIDDIDPSLTVVSGRTGLAHAAIRRVSTPRYGLHYDLNYGYDVRNELGKPQGEANRLSARRIEHEILQDERINDVGASVEFVAVAESPDETDDTLTITIHITDDDGPFELVLAVGSVTVELLELNT